jgi:hypothetical protein
MPPNPPGRHGGLEAPSAPHVRYTPARYLAVPRACVAVALLSRWGLGRGAPVCGVPMQSVCRPWQLRAPTPTLVPVAPLHPPPLPCTRDFHTHAALISCAWSHVGSCPLGCFGEGCGGGGRPSPWLAVFDSEFVCLWVLAVYPPPSPRLARPPPPPVPFPVLSPCRLQVYQCASSGAAWSRWQVKLRRAPCAHRHHGVGQPECLVASESPGSPPPQTSSSL